MARLDLRHLPHCRSERENLCDHAVFTGHTRDGGYATHILADPRFCFPLPQKLDAVEAAPRLCAGLIGWRCYRLAGTGLALGLYGFGAAAHILAQVAAWQGRRVYAFTRPGDAASQRLFAHFYQRLAEGDSVQEALRSARADRIGAGAAAADWAGLVVVGDGDFRLTPARWNRRRMIAAATGAVLVLLLAALTRRRQVVAEAR